MDAAQAKELLLFHSCAHPNVHHPKWEQGFLGSLRPYCGSLNENNFHEVMQAIQVLAPQLEQPQVDRQLVSALWGICHMATMWGIHPEGMLRQNTLIADKDAETLASWVGCISYAMFSLLDGVGVEEAFAEYRCLGYGDGKA